MTVTRRDILRALGIGAAAVAAPATTSGDLADTLTVTVHPAAPAVKGPGYKTILNG